MKGEYDRYDSVHPEGNSRCPWCGEQIEPLEDVVTIDGREGKDVALAGTGFLHVRTYHPRCLRKRQLVKRAAENESLSRWAKNE